jgi:hypothetical protein
VGISKLKRLIVDDIALTFDVRGMQHFVREIDRNLDLYKLAGLPDEYAIPRKDAAATIVDYFFETKRVVQLLDMILYISQNGFKGEPKYFSYLQFIIKEMDECGFHYDEKMKKVIIKSNEQEKRNDWGFLEEGITYNFCFVSVDICENTRIVRKYDNSIVKETYKNFNRLITNLSEARKGRIWHWEGDGGLIVYHLDDFVNQAVLTSIEILSSMAIFNATANFLGENIKIRIGINAGTAEYKKNTNSITSDSIDLTKLIEKTHTEQSSISITKHTISHVDPFIRNYFVEKYFNSMDIFQLKVPIIGSRT